MELNYAVRFRSIQKISAPTKWLTSDLLEIKSVKEYSLGKDKTSSNEICDIYQKQLLNGFAKSLPLNVKIWGGGGGGIMASLQNFVASCSVMIKFGVHQEFDKNLPKSPQNIRMMSYFAVKH